MRHDEQPGEHHQVVVVGDIVIFEPRDQDYFQPLFSHIGAGAARMAEAVRPQDAGVPCGAE
jgi:sulfide:quinone oxidoreductase